ncbi:MAG: hypothetical protein KF812_12715 [Fimbriimonadaceae bacterium]|nr:hypothetical protein [Fimbriimonadaceae bacterium]
MRLAGAISGLMLIVIEAITISNEVLVTRGSAGVTLYHSGTGTLVPGLAWLLAGLFLIVISFLFPRK